MKIGIDCRMYGLKHAGIGRYLKNLVEELLLQDKENEYVLFVRKDWKSQNSHFGEILSSNLKTIIAEFPHYSFKEQIIFPFLIAREKVDLMHFPHFNVPILYTGKYIVTIHDLIKHTSRGAETTTRSPLTYWLKYLGYKLIFRSVVTSSSKIIVPSNTIKNELVNEYKICSDKIVVTYEGVGKNLKTQISKLKFETQSSKLLEKHDIKKPYLLYVGSVYPHKNVERLIEAVKLVNSDQLSVISKKKLITNHQSLITLVIVCGRNVFWERLQKKVKEKKAEDFVIMTGFLTDGELAVLYQEAEVFVFPTLSEGFGLPGLEAMAANCPVVCSDIPVLREIYGSAAQYFNPLDPKDMAEKIKMVISRKDIRNNLIKEGKLQANKYSWSKMASETLQVYNSVIQ